jgi:uncharacterized protein (DUF849 family)
VASPSQLGPVIIEAAINGVTSKARNPQVPTAPDEIAAGARACLDGGAAIVHNHIDRFAVPGDEAAARYLEAWRPVLVERSDALFYPTTNAAPTVEESYSHFAPLADAGCLRIGLCDPGSVNLGGSDADGRPGTGGVVYANSPPDIRYQMELCERLQVGPSLSIFEPGFLRAALAYHAAGRLPAGAMVKLYFGGPAGYLNPGSAGVSFGLPPTAKALDAYLELLEGSGLPWSVAVLGGDVVASGIARLAIEAGGHLRVGLEDYAGDRMPSNTELMAEAVAVVEDAGRSVASCAEAADILQLPRATTAA